MFVWLSFFVNCHYSLYDPNHKTGNSIWCTYHLQRNYIRKTSIPLANEPFWQVSYGMCPPIYVTQCIISTSHVLEILIDLFWQCPWYIFFHSFFALRVLVGIFGFLTFVFMLFMFQNVAMGGHKTYYFSDVGYRGNESPPHLEWIAHVNFYSWKYCLKF